MEWSDIITPVLVLLFITILTIIAVYLIGNFAHQSVSWGAEQGQEIAKTGETVLNTVDKEGQVNDLKTIYKEETISGVASFFNIPDEKVKCVNKADYVKITEHSLQVKGVIPGTLYCAQIEKVYTPEVRGDIIRHNFFTILFSMKKEGDFHILQVLLVDAREHLFGKNLAIRENVNAGDYTIYFDNVFYWGGRDDDNLDNVKVKLRVGFKKDETNNIDVYIVSYIMGAYDT